MRTTEIWGEERGWFIYGLCGDEQARAIVQEEFGVEREEIGAVCARAWRRVPDVWSGCGGSYYEPASERQSPIGQFFGTMVYPV